MTSTDADTAGTTDRRPRRMNAMTWDEQRVVRVELPETSSRSARSVTRQLTRLARRLPAQVDVVVVSIPSIEALTVDLLAGIAVSRRLMTAHGRQLLVQVPGRPATPGADALLGTMPFVVTSGAPT